MLPEERHRGFEPGHQLHVKIALEHSLETWIHCKERVQHVVAEIPKDAWAGGLQQCKKKLF